jgi:thymidylate synthase
MIQYKAMLAHVLKYGVLKGNRTDTKTLDVFGYPQFRHDMREGFPLLTTKKMHTKSIVHELIWFISGDTNIQYLKDNGVSIWDEWADECGDLGPVYGKQWRCWEPKMVVEMPWAPGDKYWAYGKRIDQLQVMIDTIKNNPDSRRNIVTAWNPSDIPDMKLPPCHMFFQVNVENEFLDLHMYQRSADLFLGVPFNIASYGLLLSMLAQVTDKTPRNLFTSYGSLHIYENHIDQCLIQVRREPMPLCQLQLNPAVKNIDDFTYDDVKFVNYESHPPLKGDVAV